MAAEGRAWDTTHTRQQPSNTPQSTEKPLFCRLRGCSSPVFALIAQTETHRAHRDRAQGHGRAYIGFKQGACSPPYHSMPIWNVRRVLTLRYTPNLQEFPTTQNYFCRLLRQESEPGPTPSMLSTLNCDCMHRETEASTPQHGTDPRPAPPAPVCVSLCKHRNKIYPRSP